MAKACEHKFGLPGEKCLLFPSKAIAMHCRQFLINLPSPPAPVRLIEYHVDASDDTKAPRSSCISLHGVFFPQEAFPLAKQFWQHTGMGISSRLAEYCLSLIQPGTGHTNGSNTSPTHNVASRPTKNMNRHYSATPKLSSISDEVDKDHDMYLEERYGRNLPVGQAAMAKRALRRRIAGVLVRDNPSEECGGLPCAGASNVELGPSSRGVKDVTEEDVYLFQTGMSAIWNAHHLAIALKPQGKGICFG